jgi:hypothetical protein
VRRGLVLAGAVVALLVAATVATGRVDNPISQLTAIRNPFNEVSAALSEVTQRERAWHVLTREANSVCARYEPSKLVIRPVMPRNRADYAPAIGLALDRERAIQAELATLQPPPNYRGPYSQFLTNRQVALAALERMQRAVVEKNREKYVPAARELALRKSLIDHYAPAAGMPACVF